MSDEQGLLFREGQHGLYPNIPGADEHGDPRPIAKQVRRLSRQCHAIHERLQRGPATNHELARISLKYTARISDLRKAGINVECYDHDHATGLTRYHLAPPAT